MQPHGISANIATPISESATFVNVMAFLHPCTVYFKQVTHSGPSQYEQILDQVASSSAGMVAAACIRSKATKHRDCRQGVKAARSDCRHQILISIKHASAGRG